MCDDRILPSKLWHAALLWEDGLGLSSVFTELQLSSLVPVAAELFGVLRAGASTSKDDDGGEQHCAFLSKLTKHRISWETIKDKA